jgi:phosphate transport system permease protein
MAKQQPAESWSNGKSVFRHGDVPFRVGTVVLASCVVGLVLAMGVIMFVSSGEARSAFGWDVLFGQVWNPVATDLAAPTFGAWPAVRGTLLSSLVAIVIAAPLALGIGIFLAELCPPQLSTPLSFLVELLARSPALFMGYGVYLCLCRFLMWCFRSLSAKL